MAKKICTILGVVFLLVGVAGFAVPDLLGTHLSAAHSVIHLVSGGLALYLGLKGTNRTARSFCLIFGAVYGLLGIAGFVAGGEGAPSAGVPGPHDSHLLRVIPGVLELGRMDHIIHILLGVVFLVGGLMDRERRG
jgi:hypothetical protein